MDVNGNGILSLAEVDKGMRDIVRLPTLFAIKPVLIRAFYAAKDKVKSNKSYADDYISKGEFRFLLKFLRQYYEYWVAFDRVDTDHDRRLTYKEFLQSASKLEQWGIDMSDPESIWREVDRNGGGKILFDEFCDWAIRKNLDLEDDDDDDTDREEEFNIPAYKTKASSKGPSFSLNVTQEKK
jgi:EF-hand domain pair